jgi:hypothetical protein
MSEFTPSQNQEQLSPEVQTYLKYATDTLLASGIGDLLKDYFEEYKQFIFELYDDEQDRAESIVLKQEYLTAELPFAIYVQKFESGRTVWSSGTRYDLVKVDDRGHAYHCQNIEIFSRYRGGGRRTEWRPDKEVSQDLVDTVLKLAKKQRKLGWEPIFDQNDVP